MASKKTTTKKVAVKKAAKKTVIKKVATKKKPIANSKKTSTKKKTIKKVSSTSNKVSKADEVKKVDIEHNTETVVEYNKPKIDIFKKSWFNKDKKKETPKEPNNNNEPSYSEQLADARYVRKRKRKK